MLRSAATVRAERAVMGAEGVGTPRCTPQHTLLATAGWLTLSETLDPVSTGRSQAGATASCGRCPAQCCSSLITSLALHTPQETPNPAVAVCCQSLPQLTAQAHSCSCASHTTGGAERRHCRLRPWRSGQVHRSGDPGCEGRWQQSRRRRPLPVLLPCPCSRRTCQVLTVSSRHRCRRLSPYGRCHSGGPLPAPDTTRPPDHTSL